MNTKIAGYNAEAVAKEGVTPVYEILFGICTKGRKKSDTAETVETTVVKDAESLGISIDGSMEEWKPMDQEGWTERLMTAKSIGVSLGGKRNYGDPGNDYVASLATKNGQDCNSWFSIIFPNLDQLIIPCVVNVTSMGGDSTSSNALEWEIQSSGKPTYIVYEAA